MELPQRTPTWIAVLVGHLAFIWFVTHEPVYRAPPFTATGALVMVSLAPMSMESVFARLPIQMLPVGQIVSDLHPLGDISDRADPAAPVHSGGITIPPRPSDARFIGSSEFAGISGLLKGSGATVVLRVEVRGNGVVGRVEVDVSGGSRKVDRAAIAYVRGLKWVGGRVDDIPETLWIRWGVRLDG
jgi:TonB family protein